MRKREFTVRFSTGRRVAILILTFLVVSVIWFRFGPAAAVAARGVPLPDTWRDYSPTELYEAFVQLGPEGRRSYTYFLLGDFLYPVLFAAAVASIYLLALRSVNWLGTGARLLLLLPLSVMLLDWAENALQLRLVSTFPRRSDGLATAAATITRGKLMLINGSLSGAVAALVLILGSVMRRRAKSGGFS